ncbi:hypothetical protein [uncultured Methanospirillum sp.]|uniref:hypothetical protein n=1 Tax=uncultured Methanospirillum sp. TaxID=262503 RepID=UPI003749FCCA
MKRLSLWACLFVLLIGAITVSGAQSIDLDTNISNLSNVINSSMNLPNNTQVNIYINMPINVYVEKGDGFHILHLGDENLTTAIFNSTDKKEGGGYEFKDIVLSKGPLAELNITGNV